MSDCIQSTSSSILSTDDQSLASVNVYRKPQPRMAGRRSQGVGYNRFQEPLDNDDVRRSLEMLDDVLAQFDDGHQRQPPTMSADIATLPRARSRRTVDMVSHPRPIPSPEDRTALTTSISNSDVRNNNVNAVDNLPRFRCVAPTESLARRPPPIPKRSPNTRLTGLPATASCSSLNNRRRTRSPTASRNDRKVPSSTGPSNRNRSLDLTMFTANSSPQHRQTEKFDVCAELLKYLSELTQELMAETSFTEPGFNKKAEPQEDAVRSSIPHLPTQKSECSASTASVATQTELPGHKWSQTPSRGPTGRQKTFETIERLLREGSLEGVDDDPPEFKPPPPPTTVINEDSRKRKSTPAKAQWRPPERSCAEKSTEPMKVPPARKPPPPPTGSVLSRATSLEAAVIKVHTGRGAALVGSVPTLPKALGLDTPRTDQEPKRPALSRSREGQQRTVAIIEPRDCEPAPEVTKGSSPHRNKSCGTSCSCLCLKYQSPCQSPSTVTSSTTRRPATVPVPPAQPVEIRPILPSPFTAGTSSSGLGVKKISSTVIRTESVMAPSNRMPGDQRVNVAYNAVIAEIQAAIKHRSLAIYR